MFTIAFIIYFYFMFSSQYKKSAKVIFTSKNYSNINEMIFTPSFYRLLSPALMFL